MMSDTGKHKLTPQRRMVILSVLLKYGNKFWKYTPNGSMDLLTTILPVVMKKLVRLI